MIFCGIDPGIKGGLAFIDFDKKTLNVYPMPFVTHPNGDKLVLGGDIYALLTTHQPTELMIEDVGAMPTDGVVSAFNFGLRTGTVWGAMQTYVTQEVVGRIHKVRPSVWKPAMNVSSDKKLTGNMAHKLLPNCHKILPLSKDGLFEATMLAIYLAFLSKKSNEYAMLLKCIKPGEPTNG